MKRLLALLVVLGLVLAPGRLAAQQIPVRLGGELSSLVGIPIEVPLVVDLSGRPERLGSFSVRLQWDPAVLRLEVGRYGSFGEVAANDDSVALGIIRLAGVNPIGASGLITIGNLRLTPLANATTTLDLTLGELFAAGTFADLKPSAVVTDGLYCPARGYWGDIDKDGNANSRDALIALSNAVGLDVSAFDVSLGDVDGDGATNARDALIILSNAVGVSTSGFRVLRLAGGACAANAGVTLAIAPAGVELVSGQELLFEARASDGAGALQTITDVSWKSSDPAVLGIFADGRAVARGAGTAVVTVLRGTRDSAQTAVTVVARRTTHWVDILAKDARVRLGTAALPFGSIEAALNFAQDGDTVRVRPGRYVPDNEWGEFYLDRPVVLMGDTAADGSRPTVVGTGFESGEDGIDLIGAGTRELHNFTFEDFGAGVWVNGPDRVLLRGVQLQRVWLGVYVSTPAKNVRIERSRMQGITNYGESSGGYGLTVDAEVDTLTIEDSEIGDFQSGVYEYSTIDSLTVRRSVLHDFQSYGLKLGTYGEVCSECSPPVPRPGSVRAAARARADAAPMRAPQGVAAGNPLGRAVVVDSSRIERAGNYLVDVEADVRRVAFSHNVFSNPGEDVLYLYGTGDRGYVSMKGDSIVAPPEQQANDWIRAEYLDSLKVDSLTVVGFERGYTYDVRLIRMTNSVLKDLQDYGLEVGFGHSTIGGVLQLDNVGLYGDARNDLQGDGIEHSGARVEANRVTAVNLSEGIDAECSDSSTTITNSLFRHVERPIYWCSQSNPAPGTSVLTVQNTTFRGFSTAIEANDGRVVVDSNTFVNGDLALDVSGPRPITVTRNRITSVRGGMDLYPSDSSVTVAVADNVLVDVGEWGIYGEEDTYFTSPDTLQTVFDVRRNTVTCNSAGAVDGEGIELHDAHMSVLNNQVSGCRSGILTVVENSNPRRDSIVGNTIAVPPNTRAGIGVTGRALARVGRNIVSGAATGVQQAGLIDVSSCPAYACPDENVPSALVDSNQVTGGTTWGIRVEDVDTMGIVGNTVRNLNSPSGGYIIPSEDYGAIAARYSFSNLARIVGNFIRHIAGNGIVVRNYSATTMVVDSNVVADIDTTVTGGNGIGIYYANNGPVEITRNLVTGTRRVGISIGGSDGPASVTGNNIAGNLGYGLYYWTDITFDAKNNWWGDQSGPSCATCTGGTGDSVYGLSSGDYEPVLSAPNPAAPGLPLPAPRFLAQSLRVPVAQPSASSDPLDAPIPRRDRNAGPPRAQSQRPGPTTGAVSGPAAERRAAQERERATVAARRAERLEQLRARAEARDRARQAAASAPRRTRGQEVRP